MACARQAGLAPKCLFKFSELLKILLRHEGLGQGKYLPEGGGDFFGIVAVGVVDSVVGGGWVFLLVGLFCC
jgi:hypothetical protein